MRPLLLLIWSLFTSVLQAQWALPSVNTPVSGASGDAATPLSAPGPDGSTYVCWFESGGEGYALRMQRLSADGAAMWDPAGSLVSDEPQNSALFRYDLASDHAGNAIVAFQDERTGTLDVVAYKVAADGTLPWGNGLVLPTTGGTGLGPVIGVLADDRIVFAWNTDHSPATVAYLEVDADGTPNPAGTQEITSTLNLGRPRVVPCNDGGFWIQYVEQSGNFLSPGTMKVVRFTSDMVPSAPLVLSTKTISGFHFPQPIPDGANGMYVSFNTGNAANANLTDVYVQRLRGNGSTWSGTGTPVEDGATSQRYTGTATPALVNDDDGLMLAYSRTNTNQDQGGIAVQRFDTTGERQLSVQGVQVMPLSAELPGPFGNAAVVDGIVCAQMQGGFNGSTLSAFRLALDGSIIDPPAEIPVCTVTSGKDDPTLVPFRDGQAVAVWMDQRSGSGAIYAQPIEVENTSGISARTIAPVRVIGGAQPALLFTSGTTVITPLCIYSADGRLLSSTRLTAQASGSRVDLPMQGLSAGAFLVVLELPGGRHVERIVMQ